MMDHNTAVAASRDFDLVLVLSGGNALGAFEAGVYEVLHHRGLQPDWIVGTSIGAINGALIAGAPPEKRIETLRAFWRPDPSASAPITDAGPLSFPWSMAETWRRSNAAISTFAAGRPGLFGPLLSALAPLAPNEPSLFETHQLETTLDRLVDFARLNVGAPRFTATALDLETGEDVVFDTASRRIDARHVRASAALPVLFPPVEIDGRWHVDGGLSANLPLDPVFTEFSPRPLLCLAVDLVPLRRPRPHTLGEVASRAQDLAFASQSRRTIARWRARLADSQDRRVTLLRIVYSEQAREVAAKALDFSARTVAERWVAGRRAGEDALRAWPELRPCDEPGLSVIGG
ncbi:patatin-like phospholipase family protein [Aureimonas sp. AU22]|uniref:patatin-like phospholipase family protein n=1 Tax=Aureimonas sp. AU22 TaxID=1638162 RepID=UPI000A8C6C94|nr:patatin-like phospholipase family protein [Aureimonas sp. AU22]